MKEPILFGKKMHRKPFRFFGPPIPCFVLHRRGRVWIVRRMRLESSWYALTYKKETRTGRFFTRPRTTAMKAARALERFWRERCAK